MDNLLSLILCWGMLGSMNAKELCEYATDLAYQGRVEEMCEAFEQAIAIDGTNESNYRYAFSMLLNGMWERGWRQLGEGLKKEISGYIEPWWNGEPCKKLVVYLEGGWGDRFQFMRYLGGVHAEFASRGSKVQGDFYTSLFNLPLARKLYDPAESTRPPYLSTHPFYTERWKALLSGFSGYRVGIAWQGNPTRESEPHRSIPLRHFLTLADIPGVVLLSLQKNLGVEQLQGVKSVINLDSRLDESGRPPFSDTADVIQNLDLVITSDTAIAHLAGAMNRPVWLALNGRADWRWGLVGETTPWYPSMRLFRQRTLGDWESVFQQIATELKKLA